jgi:hypothetical protein
LKDESEISRQARWQRKQRALGLCVLCSEPAHKGMRCEKHYKQHRISMRLRYVPKVRGRYVTRNDRLEAEEAKGGAGDHPAGAPAKSRGSGGEKLPSRSPRGRAATSKNPKEPGSGRGEVSASNRATSSPKAATPDKSSKKRPRRSPRRT